MKRLLFFMLLATQVAAAQFPVTEVSRTFQRIDESLATEIDALVLDALTTATFPGGALGVVLNGEVAYIAGFGYRDVPFSCSTIADGNTQFRTASICKPLTGVLVNLVAADYPEFSIDDEVENWLPASVLPKAVGTGVTVRQLMNHDARMSNYGDGWDVTSGYNLDAAQTGMWSGNMPPDFDPLYDAVKALDVVDQMSFFTASYNYSTAHYMILSAILQVVTGQRYTDLMKEYISEPLSMHRFEPEYAWKQYENITARFDSSGSGQLLPNPEPSYIHKLSAGGWLASATDYAMFIQAGVNGYFPDSALESVFGFSGGSNPTLSHTGGAPDYGYCSQVKFDSWNQNGVVWFANSRAQYLTPEYIAVYGDTAGTPSLGTKLMDLIELEAIDGTMPAFDASERNENVKTVTGAPYSGYSESSFPILNFGDADEVLVSSFDGFVTPSVGIAPPAGDVRLVADDRIFLTSGTRIAGGSRFVAYIDNVGDFVSGDGSQCFGDTRSAEDGAVEVGATGLTLWPNPSDGRFRVEGLREEDRLIVLDMVGRVVLERAVLDESGMELDVSAQPPGIYFARVVSKDGAAKTRRFVIR